MSFKLRLLSFAIALIWAAAASAQVEFLDETFDFDPKQPAVGAWLGNVNGPEGPPVFACFVAEADDNGSVSIKMTLLAVGAMGTECTEVKTDGNSLAFALPSPIGKVELTGEISEDGQRFTGTGAFTQTGADAPEPGGTFEFARTPRPNDLPKQSAYTGQLAGMGMTFVFAQTPGGNWVGHMDIPAQNLRAFPLVNIKEGDEGFSLRVPVPGGGAVVEFTLDELKRKLTGAFKQMNATLPFEFELDEEYAYRELARPQQPKPPYPYQEREIVAEHPDGWKLAGTLTIPEAEKFGEGPFPTAVLISGSGQQDRDESLLGHKPFLVVADYLTRHGIAVMRYDDRGVGGSAVDDMALVLEATTADFATDALAVVEKLRTLDIVDNSRIGLIGHSEGGEIAPMVGQMTDGIAFMVLLAGPGVPGRDLLLRQTELLLLANDADEVAVKEHSEIQKAMFAALIDDKDEEKAGELLVDLIKVQMKATGAEATDAMVEAGVEAARAQMLIPWMKYFLAYDPRPALKKTTCPVLAVNGTRDLQVWHEQNLDSIERVMKEAGRDITIIRYKDRNHLFQPTETGKFGEYAEIEITFDEAVLADMVKWIKEKVGE